VPDDFRRDVPDGGVRVAQSRERGLDGGGVPMKTAERLLFGEKELWAART
jgi:hypothetical protein